MKNEMPLDKLRRVVREVVKQFEDEGINVKHARERIVAEIINMFPQVDAIHFPDPDPDVSFLGETKTKKDLMLNAVH